MASLFEIYGRGPVKLLPLPCRPGELRSAITVIFRHTKGVEHRPHLLEIKFISNACTIKDGIGRFLSPSEGGGARNDHGGHDMADPVSKQPVTSQPFQGNQSEEEANDWKRAYGSAPSGLNSLSLCTRFRPPQPESITRTL